MIALALRDFYSPGSRIVVVNRVAVRTIWTQYGRYATNKVPPIISGESG